MSSPARASLAGVAEQAQQLELLLAVVDKARRSNRPLVVSCIASAEMLPAGCLQGDSSLLKALEPQVNLLFVGNTIYLDVHQCYHMHTWAPPKSCAAHALKIVNLESEMHLGLVHPDVGQQLA